MSRVSHWFIECSSSGRLGGGGETKVLWILIFPSSSSSSSLSLHYIVGLIAGSLETVRVSVLRCHW